VRTEESKVAAVVAGRAKNTGDARLLWGALGLDIQDLAAGLHDIRIRRAATAATSSEENESRSMDAHTAVARSMADDGHSITRIAAELGLAEDEVARIVSGEQDHVGADTVTKEPTPVVTAPTTPTDTDGPPKSQDVSILQVDELLAWADAHADQTVKDRATQARTLLHELAQRRTTDAREQELSAAIADLETRLTAARAELGTLRPAATKPGRRSPDYDPKAVRAWAKDNGFDVAPQGLVPRHVVDAWRQANAGPALLAVAG
jgi:hypothetical protein